MKRYTPTSASRIEPLECRIAPALILDGSTVQYRDVDQDLVTVKFSKNLFTGVDAAGAPLDPEDEAFQVFDFANGDLLAGDITTAQELQRLSFDGLTNPLTTAIGIKITVGKDVGGDGLVNIGAIEGERFTNIEIAGDLGRLDILNGEGKTLGSLVVNSFGKAGVASQGTGGTMYSLIDGNVGKIEIKTDLSGARLELGDGDLGSLIIGGNVIGGNEFSTTGIVDIAGNLGKLKIGGDLRGFTDAAATYVTDSGSIFVGGTIGSATIGGSLKAGKGDASASVVAFGINSIGVTGNLEGGEGADSGSIEVTNNIGKLTVGGNLVGGQGARSASVLTNNNLSSLTIGGSVTAGEGEESAAVRAGNELGSVTIKGSVTGGEGDRSGQIFAGNAIKSVSVGVDLMGGEGIDSGSVESDGKIGTVKIGDDLVGGQGDNSGAVVSGIDPDKAGDMTKVTILGDMSGGEGIGSGSVVSGGKLFSVTVNGNLIGASGDYSASITSAHAMGTIKILGDVTGFSDGAAPVEGAYSAHIGSGSKINSVSVGGDLVGGEGEGSGSITSQTLMTPDLDEQGDIAKVTIGGSVLGGDGENSGQIAAAGDLKQATIGLDLKALGAGANSGSVFAGLDLLASGLLGKLQVKGTIDGGTAGSVVEAQRIGTVQVDGSIQNRVTIAAWDDLSKVVVKGSVVGTETEPVTLSGRGQADPTKTDLAIGTVDISGNATYLKVLAGYDPAGNAVNADAQIGKVMVDGNWTAGSVVAGIADTDSDGFGDADDAAIAGGQDGIISRIAAVVIGGTLAGTAGGADHFGFTAQEVVALSIGGVAQALTSGAGNDSVDPILPTDDTSVREIVSVI
jgi:hypothetical protein